MFFFFLPFGLKAYIQSENVISICVLASKNVNIVGPQTFRVEMMMNDRHKPLKEVSLKRRQIVGGK